MSLTVRRLLLRLGGLKVPSFSSERYTESVPASRSTSAHLSPKSSSRLKPVCTAAMYKASRRSPEATESSAATFVRVQGLDLFSVGLHGLYGVGDVARDESVHRGLL